LGFSCTNNLLKLEVVLFSLFFSYLEFLIFLLIIPLHINVADRFVGIVVDGVSDVISLDQEQIRQTPELGSVINIEYIMGLGTVEDRMLMLVDIEKLMGSKDMGLIDLVVN